MNKQMRPQGESKPNPKLKSSSTQWVSVFPFPDLICYWNKDAVGVEEESIVSYHAVIVNIK